MRRVCAFEVYLEPHNFTIPACYCFCLVQRGNLPVMIYLAFFKRTLETWRMQLAALL